MASGSEKRQRDKILRIRCLSEEFKAIVARADKAGLATGAFARAALLGNAGPRAQRRPPADHKALRQILGQVNRTGNNVNQGIRVLQLQKFADLPNVQEALRSLIDMKAAILDIRSAIYDALGKNHDPEP